MSVSVLTDSYEGAFDVFLIAGGDSDFLPLVKALRKRGKMTVGYLGDNGSEQLRQSFNDTVDAPRPPDLFAHKTSSSIEPKASPEIVRRKLRELYEIIQAEIHRSRTSSPRTIVT